MAERLDSREPWQPPDVCLASLIVVVTMLATVALALSTALLCLYVRRAGFPPPLLVGLWCLYAAVLVTCIKAMADWVCDRRARRFVGDDDA